MEGERPSPPALFTAVHHCRNRLYKASVMPEEEIHSIHPVEAMRDELLWRNAAAGYQLRHPRKKEPSASAVHAFDGVIAISVPPSVPFQAIKRRTPHSLSHAPSEQIQNLILSKKNRPGLQNHCAFSHLLKHLVRYMVSGPEL